MGKRFVSSMTLSTPRASMAHSLRKIHALRLGLNHFFLQPLSSRLQLPYAGSSALQPHYLAHFLVRGWKGVPQSVMSRTQVVMASLFSFSALTMDPLLMSIGRDLLRSRVPAIIGVIISPWCPLNNGFRFEGWRGRDSA